MADLMGRSGPSGDRDRAQMILVAAFALAVTFVALALVVNSAIYTENLATRSKAQSGGDALEYRHSVEQSLGEAMRFANRFNNSNYGEVTDSVTVALGNASHHLAVQSIDRGPAIALEKASPWERQGSIILQDNNSAFRSSDVGGSQKADWTVVTQADRARAFRINVTDRSVLSNLLGSAFTVTVDNANPGTSDEWEMTVFDDGGDLVVEVNRDSPAVSAQCRVSDTGPVVIDVTGATVDGEYCPALDLASGEAMHFGAGVDRPYNVSFSNGDAIKGNYSLVVTNTSVGSSTGLYTTLASPGTGSQPHAFPAMYSMEVLLDYQTPTVDYETVVRVARGEPE